MSEKKQTKGLEFEEANNSNVKDLFVNENPNVKENSINNIEVEKKEVEDLIAKIESEELDNLATNFEFEEESEFLSSPNGKNITEDNKKNYNAGSDKRQEAIKKDKKRKIIKISIISFIVLLILTGIIVGSLAIAGVFDDNSSGVNFGGNSVGNQLDNWVMSQQTQQTKVTNTINILEDRATIFAYDYLGENGKLYLNSQQAKDFKESSKKSINDQVNKEKDDLRKANGKNWEAEWDKSLTSKGFAVASQGGEEQYKDSLLVDKLKVEIQKVFTGQGYLSGVTTELDLNPSTLGYKFYSDKINGKYYAITQGNEILGGGRKAIDMQSIIDFYINFTKPLIYEEIVLPFTVTSYDKTHQIGTPGDFSHLTFASNEDAANFYSVISYAHSNKGYIDFDNFDATSSGVLHLNNLSITADTGTDTGTTTSEYNPKITNDETTTDPSAPVETSAYNENETVIIDSLTNVDKKIYTQLEFYGFVNKINDTIDPNDDLAVEDLLDMTSAGLNEFGSRVYTALNQADIKIDQSISQVFYINEIEESYYLIMSLQNDGLHLKKLIGVEKEESSGTTVLKYDANKVGQAIIKNDLNAIYNYNGMSNDDSYGLFADFNSWIETNIDVLILNTAYEFGIKLNVNDEYGWTDVITTNLQVEQNVGISTLEEQMYREPALTMYMNFIKLKDSYRSYVNTYKVALKENSNFDNVTNEDYIELRRLTNYYESSTINSNWNSFLINFDSTVTSGPYGAVKIFKKN